MVVARFFSFGSFQHLSPTNQPANPAEYFFQSIPLWNQGRFRPRCSPCVLVDRRIRCQFTSSVAHTFSLSVRLICSPHIFLILAGIFNTSWGQVAGIFNTSWGQVAGICTPLGARSNLCACKTTALAITVASFALLTTARLRVGRDGAEGGERG
jgi:hypothetical protein